MGRGISRRARFRHPDFPLRQTHEGANPAPAGQGRENAAQAAKNLLLDIVHPDDKAAFTASMEEYPGIASTFASSIIKGVGISAELGN